MSVSEIEEPIHSLTKAFLLNYPSDSARQVESMSTLDAVNSLGEYPTSAVVRVMEFMSPGILDALLLAFPRNKASEILSLMDTGISSPILARVSGEDREELLLLMQSSTAKELRTLLEYPENTAGREMKTNVLAFHNGLSVGEAVSRMKEQKITQINHLFLLNDSLELYGQVDVSRLVLAEEDAKLNAISQTANAFVSPLDPREEFMEMFEKYRTETIPVVDMGHRLIGVLEKHESMEHLREEMASSMQTMVGASKDERALSSSFFAVKKRLPWLQINLLTAFLAAAVVGLFQETISKYTALAILLPIAAGQSGNAGAQALAVTMRGLTLREISMKHWLRVLMKECGAGFMNGIGIAITCSIGVYFWSKSFGLALVMALSMISSMTIAGMAGALVPILLKRLGLDPAQSSSIVLTTVTDIAGFMSFLGLATLMSSMLVA